MKVAQLRMLCLHRCMSLSLVKMVLVSVNYKVDDKHRSKQNEQDEIKNDLLSTAVHVLVRNICPTFERNRHKHLQIL